MNVTIESPSTTMVFDPCVPAGDFLEAVGCIEESQEFLLAIYVICGVVTCCACLAYYQKQCMKKRIRNRYALCLVNLYPNDDTSPLKFLYFSLSLIDYMTDCAWGIDIFGKPVDELWKVAAVLGVVIPYFVNVMCGLLFLRYLQTNTKHENKLQSDQWMKKHSLWTVALFGIGEPVLQLFNSKIYNLSLFSMNLRHRILDYHVKWSGVILNCTIGKVPQFIMQIMFFQSYSTLYGQMIVIAMLFSMMGMFLTVFQLLELLFSNCNNKFREERIELTFHFYFDGIPVTLASSRDILDKDGNSSINETIKIETAMKKYEMIDEVFGFRKYLLEYTGETMNFDQPKYNLVCQFVEPQYDEKCVRMMIEVVPDAKYTEEALNITSKYLNRQLRKSTILKNKINKLISMKYNDQFGPTPISLLPVKVYAIVARVIPDRNLTDLVKYPSTSKDEDVEIPLKSQTNGITHQYEHHKHHHKHHTHHHKSIILYNYNFRSSNYNLYSDTRISYYGPVNYQHHSRHHHHQLSNSTQCHHQSSPDVQTKLRLVHMEMKSNPACLQNYENSKSTPHSHGFQQSLSKRIEKQLEIKHETTISQNKRVFDQSRFRLLSDKSINEIYTTLYNLAADFGYQTYFDEKLVEFSVIVSLKDDQAKGKNVEIKMRIIPESHLKSNNNTSDNTHDRKDSTDNDKQMDSNHNSNSKDRYYITMWRADFNVRKNDRIMSRLFLNPKMMDLSDTARGDKTPIGYKVKFLIVSLVD